MFDPLELLWPALEGERPTFSRAAMVRWPEGANDLLISAKLIRPDGSARVIRCPECGDIHEEAPVARAQPDGTVRIFLPCPQYFRAELATRDLERWCVNVEGVVRGIALALSLRGRPRTLHVDRVWRCGRTDYQGKLRDVLFARGLRRKDATQLLRAINGSHRPIVFVPAEGPDRDFWRGRIPPMIQLCEVAALVNGRIEFDLNQLFGLVLAADVESNNRTGITRDRLKQVIRHQIKAEGKAVLRDDWLVAAYKQCNSYRKAANSLTEQSGQPIPKDQVWRAVQRAGGRRAVLRGDDSDSVVRTVSSRRRDTPIEKRESSK